MKGSVWITFGRVGFGYARDSLFPELRLGMVAIGGCRGALREHIEAYRAQARNALRSLGL